MRSKKRRGEQEDRRGERKGRGKRKGVEGRGDRSGGVKRISVSLLVVFVFLDCVDCHK